MAVFVALIYGSHLQPGLAEEDCVKALEIDKKNVKALYRRALARKGLKKYSESAKDLCQLLQMDPGNAAAKGELEVVKDLWRKVCWILVLYCVYAVPVLYCVYAVPVLYCVYAVPVLYCVYAVPVLYCVYAVPVLYCVYAVPVLYCVYAVPVLYCVHPGCKCDWLFILVHLRILKHLDIPLKLLIHQLQVGGARGREIKLKRRK